MRISINNNMKNILRLLCALAAAAMICGCTAEKEIPEETVSETESTTENYDYILVRKWSADDLIDSIFYCGEFHPLPLVPEENEGFSYSDGILTFPDGSFAAAAADEDGKIISLTFEAYSAPRDFSVFGINFSSIPDDIPTRLGIAENVYEDKSGRLIYSFSGGGIDRLTFIYAGSTLVSVYISVGA